MPRQNINYQNTIIYKWVCNDLNITDIYVGSTTDIIRRKQAHKSTCNNEKSENHNLKIYKIMRANGGFSNWTMLEIDKFPCNNKAESLVKERYWYEVLSAKMNTNVPSNTSNLDYHKDYYIDNKEEINATTKQYYIDKDYYQENKEHLKDCSKDYYNDNKDKLLEKANTKLTCVCGCNYTRANKNQHIKSNKHLSYINNQNNSEINILENEINNIV